jgi:hypothetical protein
MILWPHGLKALKQVAKQVGADLRGASPNLDGGCDAAHHRHGMFHTGLIPTITESPRKRKTTTRRRKRRFDAAIHALRMHGRTDLGVGGHMPVVVAPC